MKIASATKVMAIVLALSFIVPTTAMYIGGSDMEEQLNDKEYVIVYVPGDGTQMLAPYNLDIVETYDGFVLARADMTQITAMTNRNIGVGDASHMFDIMMKAVDFDVRQGEPAVPASLKIDGYQAESKGYYIVQFLGPIKDEWKSMLRVNGAEILRYIPNNAFLVRTTPEALDSISSLRQVTWTGIYQPAYKIDPALHGASGLTQIEVVTYPGTPVVSVVAKLNKMGYGNTERYGEGPGVISYYQADEFGLVRARVDASILPAIATMKHVEYVEPYYLPDVNQYYAQAIHQTGLDPFSAGARRIWDMGIRGQGQIIGVSDTGVDYDHNFYRHDDTTITIGDIYNVTDMSRRKVIRYFVMSNYSNVDPFTDEWAWKDSAVGVGPCTSGHGTATSSVAVANDDGIGISDNDGMAKEAKLVFQDIGTVGPTAACGNMDDDVLSYITDDLNIMFQLAYDEGARFHSNSWGGGTATYGLSSMQIDQFMWNNPDMLVVFAEGNDGGMLGNVQEQASAKNVLSAGGTFTYPTENGMTTYSAWGPTADGRQKPTVSVVSEGSAAYSDRSPWSNTNRDLEWGPSGFGGTSYASPNAAGHAALVRQYFTEGWYPTGTAIANNAFNPQASLVTAMLAASSVKMTGVRTNPAAENRYPNDAQGWGRPLLDNALYFNGDSRFTKVVDSQVGLKTGLYEEYQVYVSNSSQIMKIILAWTDYPGAVGASRALVNDLDLEVIAPNADSYKGNVWDIFSVGESRKNTGTFDLVNNIEGVIVNTPLTGVWTIRITGKNVPQGPQPFSLAMVGGFDVGYGEVTIDKHTYTENDVIQITVVDPDATGSVLVNVSSANMEPWPEEYQLNETDVGSGVFTGSVQTSFGTPLINQILEVSEGDTIIVEYDDVSPPHISAAYAIVETIKPIISNVRVTGITSSTATIQWDTDIPADSWVYYNVTTPLDIEKSARELALSHAVTLFNLQTATLYFFDVASSDGEGHRTIDTNTGLHYAFKTTDKGEILLVLGDETYEQERPEGVRAYRASLASKGWSYNEWHVEYSGDPPLALLQTYKVVIWQVGLEQYPPHTDQQLQLIHNYLDEGGRLFYVHHDTHWAFCAITSSWFDTTRCSWIEAILKASFNEFNPNAGDPRTMTNIDGVTGDPISGDYATGGPQYPTTYVYFREGGVADEVTQLPTGGITTYVWRSRGGDANPDYISVKWISSANNGTAGPNKVWGGRLSKQVSLFANWIDIDFMPGSDYSVKRTDILDKTIIWLLDDRDHPDVTISTPNGGETVTGDIVTIFWNATTYGGTLIADQAAFYSFDAGQSWFLITPNIPGTNVSHPWYLANACNGDSYMVRVEVRDDGSPAFNASDDSDDVFTINRATGDCGGPKVWAGNPRVLPNPVMGPVPVNVTATVDDRLFGNSNIHLNRPAEFFIDTIGADGLGWGMNMTNPPSSPVEEVTWTGTLDWLSKICHTMFIHGQDVLGNWGPYENSTFCVQNPPPSRPPRGPKNPNAFLMNGANDVRITWQLSPDDLLSVDHYEVWYSTNVYDPAQGGTYVWLGNSPQSTTSFDHIGVGRDANTYYYIVKAVNPGGNSSTPDQAVKFARSLSVGMHLVGIPPVTADMSLSTIFQTINYDSVRWFDPLKVVDPWMSYMPGRTYNDFTWASADMGLWVDVTAAGVYCVAGKVPTSSTITLRQGWNLVNFPHFTMTYTVADLKASMPGNVLAVEAYDASAPGYLLQRVGDSFVMMAGYGYWIKVANTGGWTLTN